MTSSEPCGIPSCDFLEDVQTFVTRALHDSEKFIRRVDNPRDSHFQCSISKNDKCDYCKLHLRFNTLINQIGKLQSMCSEHRKEHERVFRTPAGRCQSNEERDSGIGSATSTGLNRTASDVGTNTAEEIPAGDFRRCSVSGDTETAARVVHCEAQTRIKMAYQILDKDSDETSSDSSSSNGSTGEDTSQQDADTSSQDL